MLTVHFWFNILLYIKCIVQSYVQWLQDSDYNPICLLCKDLLKEKATIRLACYGINKTQFIYYRKTSIYRTGVSTFFRRITSESFVI